MYETKWYVIRRGFVGWHAEGLTIKDNLRATGSGGTFESYLAEAADDCFVVDASEVPENDFVHFTIAGPMVDLKLPQWGFQRLLGDVQEVDPTEVFTMETLRKDYDINGFTTIGIGIYRTLASHLKNVKLGYVVAGNVSWWS